MANHLKIIVTDPDPDYLGIEITASSGRFSATTKIYAGVEELTRFAERIAGFPRNREDERTYVFGTKDKGCAGGYCALRFYCRDDRGHAAVELDFEDDEVHYSSASARFILLALPAEIDDFVKRLGLIERERSGEAKLENFCTM